MTDGPRADLIRTASEVTDELQARVTGDGDLAQVARSADLLLLLSLLLRSHLCKTLLESDGEGDERVARVVLVDPGLDLGQPLVLLADVVALGEVDEVRDGLRGEELEAVHDVDLWGRRG